VTTAPKSAESQVRNSTHILIVDDDREAGKSLALMLSATGYDEIKTVRSAARALAVASTFQPAIAFLGTPQAGDGSELAAQLQKNARPQGVRIIGLTDSVEHPSKEVARAAGLERYLTRPVVQLDLEKVLRKA
jgi:CheY-like chemotaxis protein